MRTQRTSLYAVNRAGEFFVVIGWSEDASTNRIYPIVVPLGKFGGPVMVQGDLAYLVEAPIPDMAALDRQMRPMPPSVRRGTGTPSDAMTEVIQRIPRA